MWFVYMLRCADGSLYSGSTTDLRLRVRKHQAGVGAAYTRSRLPVRVVWAEPAADRSAALRRECALKRLSRPEKLALARSPAGKALARSLVRARVSPSVRGAARLG